MAVLQRSAPETLEILCSQSSCTLAARCYLALCKQKNRRAPELLLCMVWSLPIYCALTLTNSGEKWSLPSGCQEHVCLYEAAGSCSCSQTMRLQDQPAIGVEGEEVHHIQSFPSTIFLVTPKHLLFAPGWETTEGAKRNCCLGLDRICSFKTARQTEKCAWEDVTCCCTPSCTHAFEMQITAVKHATFPSEPALHLTHTEQKGHLNLHGKATNPSDP